MPYIDPQAQRDYQKRWMRQKRLDATESLGGKCVKCSSKESLELDHIDPSTKTKGALLELHLCQLLCATCHAKKTRLEGGAGVDTLRAIYSGEGSNRAIARKLNISHTTVNTYRESNREN